MIIQMDITASQQVYVFAAAAICGIGLGILFDIFRIIRKIRKPSMVGISMQDVLYWLAAAILVFWYIFTFNDGELRWYEFAGVFLAGYIYNMTLSKYTVKIGIFLCRFLEKMAVIIIKILLVPIVFFYRLIKKPLFVVFNATGRGAKRYRRLQKGVSSKILQSLQNFWKIFKKV